RLSYLGGWLPLSTEQAERATRLALAAIAAMPPTRGYVGVDLVLGEGVAGQDDRVIEINPRLTTSYAALRSAVEENLAEQMLAATGGTPVKLTPTGKSIEFDADGSIRRQNIDFMPNSQVNG
ncbi:MAG: ATP-grasp domain-containing protein, partial [Planctomycetota bacterium]